MELFSGNRFYGHSRILKAYARLPNFLPFPATIQHGWTAQWTDSVSFDVRSPLKYCWAWSERAAELFEARGIRDVVIGGAPFVYLADDLWKGTSDGRAGTIAFSLHGTQHVDIVGDFDEYARELASLPEKFKPVTVCLHHRDLEKGLAEPFRRQGLRITSNGNMYDSRFLERFILNCSPVRYATSNALTTASLYCMYLGIPFFFYGPGMEALNRSDPAIPLGPIGNRGALGYLETTLTLESLGDPETLNFQRSFAHRELGSAYKLSRNRLQREFLTMMMTRDFARSLAEKCPASFKLPTG